MATHSSIIAWRIPWIEEAGGLQSMGSQSQTQLSNWTTKTRVDLQFCVSFYNTAKWNSYTYISTHSHSFLDSFPIEAITEYCVEFPGLYSRFLLIICFIYSSRCMSVPISQFIFLPLFLLGNHSFVFYNCDSISFINKCIWAICHSPHTRDITWFFFCLSLSYLTQYDNL